MRLRRIGAPSALKKRPIRTPIQPPTYELSENGIEMATDHEDRLDRNNRNISAGNENLAEKLYAVREAMAVIATKLEGLTGTVVTGFSNVDNTFREFNSRYATKEDVKGVADDLKEVKKNIARGVWIILTAVIVAVLTLTFKAGLVHA